MFLNSNKTEKKAAQSAVIFDVTAQDFEGKVLQESMNVPVIVDFWAPWCGPCKQLMPVLESAVNAAKGKVRLAKVNIDDNPELAQALRVQSVPTVYAFFMGQPVNAFAGAKPESEIKAFIQQLVKLAQQQNPEAIDIPQALSQAAAALSAHDLATAQELYISVLQQDETNAQAYAGLLRVFIAAGDLDHARQMIANTPPELAGHAEIQAAQKALEMAEAAPDKGRLQELETQLARGPGDQGVRFDLAAGQFAAGRQEEGIENLLEIIRQDREWEDQKARKKLLEFFEILGPSDPLTIKARKKLSSILFS